jgi:hypothetical protein
MIIKRSIYQRTHGKLSIKESTGNLAMDSGAFDLKEMRKDNEHTKKYLYLLSLYPKNFWL